MPLDSKVDNFTSFPLFISSFFFSSQPFIPAMCAFMENYTFKPDSLVRDNYTKNH